MESTSMPCDEPETQHSMTSNLDCDTSAMSSKVVESDPKGVKEADPEGAIKEQSYSRQGTPSIFDLSRFYSNDIKVVARKSVLRM